MLNPDLIALGTRVLERALQKTGHIPLHVYDAGEVPPPDDTLVDNLAGQLIGFVGKLDTKFSTPLLQAGVTSSQLEQERSRNRMLARALGACECWGESSDCAQCGGCGGPGWQLPDRAHFEAFVRPALRKVSHFRFAARNQRRHSLQR